MSFCPLSKRFEESSLVDEFKKKVSEVVQFGEFELSHVVAL